MFDIKCLKQFTLLLYVFHINDFEVSLWYNEDCIRTCFMQDRTLLRPAGVVWKNIGLCLPLALTACSQGQAEKVKLQQHLAKKNFPSEKKKKKENVRTKIFSTELNDHHRNKIQVGYKKEKKLSLLLFLLNPFPLICKTWTFRIKEIYQKRIRTERYL